MLTFLPFHTRRNTVSRHGTGTPTLIQIYTQLSSSSATTLASTLNAAEKKYTTLQSQDATLPSLASFRVDHDFFVSHYDFCAGKARNGAPAAGPFINTPAAADHRKTALDKSTSSRGLVGISSLSALTGVLEGAAAAEEDEEQQPRKKQRSSEEDFTFVPSWGVTAAAGATAPVCILGRQTSSCSTFPQDAFRSKEGQRSTSGGKARVPRYLPAPWDSPFSLSPLAFSAAFGPPSPIAETESTTAEYFASDGDEKEMNEEMEEEDFLVPFFPIEQPPPSPLCGCLCPRALTTPPEAFWSDEELFEELPFLFNDQEGGNQSILPCNMEGSFEGVVRSPLSMGPLACRLLMTPDEEKLDEENLLREEWSAIAAADDSSFDRLFFSLL